jgi:hypothetical protein
LENEVYESRKSKNIESWSMRWFSSIKEWNCEEIGKFTAVVEYVDNEVRGVINIMISEAVKNRSAILETL